MPWQDLLLQHPEQIDALLSKIRRVAVLGMRSEAYAQRPAHYVPKALKGMGLEIVPVSIHEPEVTTMLGQSVYRHLVDIPGTLDLVDVFRARRTCRRTCPTSSPSAPARSGCRPASTTTPSPNSWRAPASPWCRTAA